MTSPNRKRPPPRRRLGVIGQRELLEEQLALSRQRALHRYLLWAMLEDSDLYRQALEDLSDKRTLH